MVKLAFDSTEQASANHLNSKRELGPEREPFVAFCPSPKQKLATRIAERLWTKLPFSRLAEETGHRGIDHVVRVASSSHVQIVEWYGDLRRLAEAIIEAAIDLQGDQLSPNYHRQLFGEIKSEMLANVSLPLPPRSFVDYQFADNEPESATVVATQHLKSHCIQIANHFVGLFDHLQKESVVGHVDSGDSTCRFSFHERIASVEQTGETQLEVERYLDPEYAHHWHKAYFNDTHQKTPAVVQHQQAIHVHHVRNPVLRLPEKTKYTIPKKYRNLLDAIPDCIRPLIRVLEGDLFREEAVKWDTRLEDRPELVLVSSEWSRCPAIVLGNYVLAGWGELAIADQEDSEDESQLAAKKVEARALAQHYAKYAKVVGAASIGLMACSPLAYSILTPLAILLGIASMYLASQSTHTDDLHQQTFPIARVLRTGGIVFASQAILFALLYASMIALSVAMLLGACAVVSPRLQPGLERQQG